MPTKKAPPRKTKIRKKPLIKKERPSDPSIGRAKARKFDPNDYKCSGKVCENPTHKPKVHFFMAGHCLTGDLVRDGQGHATCHGILSTHEGDHIVVCECECHVVKRRTKIRKKK